MRIAGEATIGQRTSVPEKFDALSRATGRKLGDAQWISDQDLTTIRGGVKLVVRRGNIVYVGYVTKIGKTSTGWPDPKLLTMADLKLIEDVILDAEREVASGVP